MHYLLRIYKPATHPPSTTTSPSLPVVAPKQLLEAGLGLDDGLIGLAEGEARVVGGERLVLLRIKGGGRDGRHARLQGDPPVGLRSCGVGVSIAWVTQNKKEEGDG